VNKKILLVVYILAGIQQLVEVSDTKILEVWLMVEVAYMKFLEVCILEEAQLMAADMNSVLDLQVHLKVIHMNQQVQHMKQVYP